jgi:tetratricopeptide (TPR) repeat protein
MVLFKPALGMARDWDLFTVVSVAWVPMALLIVVRFLKDPSARTWATHMSVPAIALSALLTGAWIQINASWTHAAARFERILAYDRSSAAYAFENLATLYRSKEQYSRAIETIKEALAVSDNPRLKEKLAAYHEAAGDLQGAMQLLRDLLEDHPDYHSARYVLIRYYYKDFKYEEIAELCREGTAIMPEHNGYWYNLAEACLALGKTDEALAAYKRAAQLDPPPSVRQRIEEQLRAYPTTEQHDRDRYPVDTNQNESN